MRTVFFLFIFAFLIACSACMGSRQIYAARDAPQAPTVSGSDMQNNMVAVTPGGQTANSPQGKTVFEGSHNLFDAIEQNPSYFDRGYDVIIVKGDGNLIRLYNAGSRDPNDKGADTLVLVGNKVKYVVATDDRGSYTLPEGSIDTITLSAQPFDTAMYTRDLPRHSQSWRTVNRLLGQIRDGDMEARFELAEVYNFGIDNTPISTAKAVSLYEYGAASGHLPSIRRLGDIWSNGTFDWRAHKPKGLYYYKLGASLGDEYCLMVLKGK